ncbi:MarR family winged helix-turn-helix transcriptional regulator [Cryobacterium sp. TMS1-20-1]|uniref:MarR family winged helix-turn-helix transcriptional regulator n=1 Tax=Cryobacterium sp. TMS1-20-1 TaxID=1259223 RepID=UPI001F53E3CF|nr:MarR family transcriptional regulator [Cryobacterium sp. TMS1-20-1]
MTESVPAMKSPPVSRAKRANTSPSEAAVTGTGAPIAVPFCSGAADSTSDRLRDPDRLRDTDLANEIEFMTARARSVGSGRANTMLAELDLRVRSYSVLSLACSGQNPSQRELAGFLSLDPSQIVALVDHLENRGAVTREQDPRDRRSKVIVATTAGRVLYRQARAVIQKAEDQSLRDLSTAEREQLRSLLRRIAFEPGH